MRNDYKIRPRAELKKGGKADLTGEKLLKQMF
jgi:hypothetical protein